MGAPVVSLWLGPVGPAALLPGVAGAWRAWLAAAASGSVPPPVLGGGGGGAPLAGRPEGGGVPRCLALAGTWSPASRR